MPKHPKVVETPHYHLWTDALHARSLAHQANNRWDRGTYVRWCVNTSWTALEVACQDATGDPNISYSFKRNLEAALKQQNLPAIDWGKGIWQKVMTLQQTRKNYVHRFVSETDLFQNADVADDAIKTTRQALSRFIPMLSGRGHLGLPTMMTVDGMSEEKRPLL